MWGPSILQNICKTEHKTSKKKYGTGSNGNFISLFIYWLIKKKNLHKYIG